MIKNRVNTSRTGGWTFYGIQGDIQKVYSSVLVELKDNLGLKGFFDSYADRYGMEAVKLTSDYLTCIAHNLVDERDRAGAEEVMSIICKARREMSNFKRETTLGDMEIEST